MVAKKGGHAARKGGQWMDGCEHGKNHHHVVGKAILSTNQHGVR